MALYNGFCEALPVVVESGAVDIFCLVFSLYLQRKVMLSLYPYSEVCNYN